MARSDPTKRPRPGPWPPVPESTAMPPSTWAKRTGFRPKFSGETNATDSGQLPVQPKPKETAPQADLELGRPPEATAVNGEVQTDKVPTPVKNQTPDKEQTLDKNQPVKRRRDSDGGAAVVVVPRKSAALPDGAASRRPARSNEGLLPQTVDDDGFVSRYSHMKYELRDTPGLVPIGLYGFQHYLSILGSLILIPLVIVPAMGGTYEDTSKVVSTVLFVSGMTTLLHTSFGSRLPLIQGPSFVFLAPTLAIINSPEFTGLNGNNFKHIMKELQGAIIIASAFQAILGYSGLMTVFLRLINPVVVSPTIAAVGLSFYSYGFSQVGKCLEIGVVQILVVIIFSLYLRKISVFGHRVFLIYAVPLGLAITWAAAFLLTEAGAYSYKGCDVNVPASNIIAEHCRKHISRMKHCRVDTSQALKSSPWFRFPYPLQWGTPVFSWKTGLVMCVVSIISSVDSVGSYHASSLLVASRPPTPGVLSRGIGLEGLTSILAGLWGTGTGSTTLTENVHTIAVTKMGSRRSVELGACVLIVLSLIGKVGGFIASIPDVMVAALLCFMWAMLAALGLSNLRYSEAGSSRNIIIVGLSLFLSLSVPAYFQQYGVSPNSNLPVSVSVTKKLEEELLKRDALIERLHEENEKLFERLTEKATSAGSTQVSSSSPKLLTNIQTGNLGRNDNNNRGRSMDVVPLSPTTNKIEGTVALVKSVTEKVKTTPAGEYLTSALNDFDPEKYDSLATVSDGANKLLMLVLAAVIKAGASREHEILSEIRDAVISFIRKIEPKRVMDTVLVSRVRILYLRSLLSRSPELQSIKVPPVERFLEKANTGRSRSSSRGSSPGRSPLHYDSSMRNALIDEQIQRFKINIKPEKKSKLSSVVLKIRGIDQETWRHHVTGGKLREITEEGKSFAVGNKALAALVVHTPTGELLRQIRSWLADNFDFLCVTADDALGGSTGQLELLSTAIMDGWMAGLGAAMLPSTDALGQLLGEYAKRVYNSQLQHLKDIAGTLATEVAEDSAQVAKLRSALESVDHKRRKLLQQMRSDEALLTLQDGGSPIRNPSTAAEDARLASLISLDGILKQVKDIMRQSTVSRLAKSKKKAMLASLDELTERMPSLLDIDHPCARTHIAEARHAVESIPEEEDPRQDTSVASKLSVDLGSGAEIDVAQWNVLQFNTGSTSPFIIKCGANSNSELVIKADARVQEPKGGEIVRVVPRPTVLENLTLEEMKEVFSQLPEALSLLALARTSDGTRARYSRLYRTLAMKVPALRDLVDELEKGGGLRDMKS